MSDAPPDSTRAPALLDDPMSGASPDGAPPEAEPENGSPASAIAKGSSFAFIGLAAGAVLQVGYNVGLARLFDAATVGVFAFGLSLATIAATIGQFGAQEALLRYSAAYRGSGERSLLRGVLEFGFTLGFVGTSVTAIALYLGADMVADLANKPEVASAIATFAIAVPVIGGIKMVGASLQGAQRLDLSAIASEAGRPGAIIAALGAAALFSLPFGGFLALMVACLAGVLVLGGVIVYRTFTSARGVSAVRRTPVWARFVLPVMFLDLFRSTAGWTDTLLLGFFADNQDVGVYFAALRVALVITLPLAAFNAVLAPISAEMWHRRDMDGLDRAFKTATRWTVAVVLPVAAVTMLLRNDLMSVFGTEFVAAGGGLVLLLLLIGRVVNGLTGGVGRLLIMTGHERVELGNTILGTVLLVGLMFAVVPRYGMIGAAVVNAIMIAFVNLVKLIQVWHYIRIQPYDRAYGKLAVALAVGGSLGLAVDHLLADAPVPVRIGVVAAVTLGVYGATLARMPLEPDDRDVLRRVAARFGR